MASYDLVMRRCRLLGSTRQSGRASCDVGVLGERIVEIAPSGSLDGVEVIEASGRYLLPGFIDTHVHCDGALFTERWREAQLMQGVTTVLLGADGFGWAPVRHHSDARALFNQSRGIYGDWVFNTEFESVSEYQSIFLREIPINVGFLAPHHAIRHFACGFSHRPATMREMRLQCDAFADWLQLGAFGLAIGLDYEPGRFASAPELVALSKLLDSSNLPIASHIRYLRLGRTAALREVIDIAQRANVPLVVSHERADSAFRRMVEKSTRPVYVDWYGYEGGSTYLHYGLPERLRDNGLAGLLALAESESGRQDIEDGFRSWLRSETKSLGRPAEYVIRLAGTASGRREGSTLAQIGTSIGDGSVPKALTSLLLREGGEVSLVWSRDWRDTEDLEDAAEAANFILASDGVYTGDGDHPRGLHCFSRALDAFFRRRGQSGLETMARVASSLPAEVYGLKGRGRVKVGAHADLVLVGPPPICNIDQSQGIQEYALSVRDVVINGQIAVRNGRLIRNDAGKVLRYGAS